MTLFYKMVRNHTYQGYRFTLELIINPSFEDDVYILNIRSLDKIKYLKRHTISRSNLSNDIKNLISDINEYVDSQIDPIKFLQNLNFEKQAIIQIP